MQFIMSDIDNVFMMKMRMANEICRSGTNDIDKIRKFLKLEKNSAVKFWVSKLKKEKIIEEKNKQFVLTDLGKKEMKAFEETKKAERLMYA